MLSVGAWGVLSALLLKCGYDPTSLNIRENCCGKPYISGPCPMHFNLSHSGNFVLCAISDLPVGCDIESDSRKRRNIAERFFAEDEVRYLSVITDLKERDREFYRLWTLKESFQKLTGLGFSLPLNSFSFVFSTGSASVNCPWGDRGYDFLEFRLPGYFCCVASFGRPFSEPLEYDFIKDKFK